MAQLEGKVAIVTGAARGLGRAYAQALATEGAAVLACDVNDCDETVAAIVQAGGKAEGVITDITSMDSCQQMAAVAVSAFGKIDILVNNAALYGGLKGARFEQLEEAQWDAVMTVNVKGVWQSCRPCGCHARSWRRLIINIASLAAVYGLPYGLDYVASKAAVIGMTRGMARELGKDSIRVNAVAPSAVMTGGTAEFFGEKLEKAKNCYCLRAADSAQSSNRRFDRHHCLSGIRQQCFCYRTNTYGRWRLMVFIVLTGLVRAAVYRGK